MKTKLLMERLDAIERQALETLKEVRAMREEMKASPRPSPEDPLLNPRIRAATIKAHRAFMSLKGGGEGSAG